MKKKLDHHEISKEKYKEDLKEIKKSEKLAGIDKEMIDSLCTYVNITENRKVIEELIKLGIKGEQETIKSDVGLFAGKTVVLTGTLENFTRQDAEEVIRKAGGNVSSSVSQKTDFVLAGSEPGSKLDKAKKFGVKVIDEKEFLEMIK